MQDHGPSLTSEYDGYLWNLESRFVPSEYYFSFDDLSHV